MSNDIKNSNELSSRDLKWQEFLHMFQTACKQWDYTPQPLDQAQMDPLSRSQDAQTRRGVEPATPETLQDRELLTDDRPKSIELLRRIKEALPELEALLTEANKEHRADNALYRFYHRSFKVYWIQGMTGQMVEKLRNLASQGPALNPWFEDIVAEGTGKEWKRADNVHWVEVTRPIIEAFLHVREVLRLTIDAGKQFNAPPRPLPYGWVGSRAFRLHDSLMKRPSIAR